MSTLVDMYIITRNLIFLWNNMACYKCINITWLRTCWPRNAKGRRNNWRKWITSLISLGLVNMHKFPWNHTTDRKLHTPQSSYTSPFHCYSLLNCTSRLIRTIWLAYGLKIPCGCGSWPKRSVDSPLATTSL